MRDSTKPPPYEPRGQRKARKARAKRKPPRIQVKPIGYLKSYPPDL